MPPRSSCLEAPYVTYFLISETDRPTLVKIGRTTRYQARFKEFQRVGFRGMYLTLIGGDFEAELHRYFHYARGAGEWFHRLDQLETFRRGSVAQRLAILDQPCPSPLCQRGCLYRR